ncbi:MAG: NAD-dependent epimerase [Bacteroidales bacterium]|nr:NAD-dependent epimerase [Bacteroidales bacterium]
MKKILITGTAGFIGFHLVKKMLQSGYQVVGMDSVNDYYDINLKYGRLEENGIPVKEMEYAKIIASRENSNHRFVQLQLEDKGEIMRLFDKESFDVVVNLAAQAGVRYSLTNPHAYIDSNISGFLNILEACRANPVSNLIYASSSSVYGLNASMPFSVKSNVDHPVSLYAASKKSNELMAHTYSHLFGIPSIGLRFFTVYGPWGRPDMALFLFADAIFRDQPIEVYNHGRMQRDFTYIDDIVDGISRMIDHPPEKNESWDAAHPDPSFSSAPYRLYNIGHNNPVKLLDFIAAIENAIGKKARMVMKPMQPGDVEKTWADVNDLISDFDYRPRTPVEEGVDHFIKWYRAYYGV